MRNVLTQLKCGLLVLAFSLAFADTLPEFPSTAGGQRAAAYVAAFNTGDEKVMRQFLEANLAPEALKRRTMDERMATYRNMRGDLKALELREVQASSDTELSVSAHSANGNVVSLTFSFDHTPAHMILGLRVDQEMGSANPPEPGQTPTPLSRSELCGMVDGYLDSLVAADEFSGTILLAHAGVPFYSKALGLANRDFNASNRLDTKFNLGSINKIFTQIAICQLAEQKELSFDDPLGKWLPDYPNQHARDKVTLVQLLTMTSGIGDFFGDRYDATPKDRLRTLDDYLALFAAEPLLFEPGSSQRYSNGGYVVLGAMIERISGQSYYDYVREHIFEPAGMTSTDSYMRDDPVPNRAVGYTRERSGGAAVPTARIENVYTAPVRGSSAGGGYSTVEDLLRFTNALKECKLLSPAATRRFLDRDYTGWESPRAEDSASVGQSVSQGSLGIAGGAPGINAVLDADFHTEYTCIVMSNYDPPAAERVGKKIRGLLARLTM
jgi:CubicO group peptidase (beta-lactamase class C family)